MAEATFPAGGSVVVRCGSMVAVTLVVVVLMRLWKYFVLKSIRKRSWQSA